MRVREENVIKQCKAVQHFFYKIWSLYNVSISIAEPTKFFMGGDVLSVSSIFP